MKAKPPKCKSLSFLYTTKGPSAYGAVQAHLRIGDDTISDISDTPFKFLGRLIFKASNEHALRNSVLNTFKDYFTQVDAQFLKGAAKIWIYNNYIMALMSWPLMIYDFPPSYADKFTVIVNKFAKSWLNVHHPPSPEIFYLPKQV